MTSYLSSLLTNTTSRYTILRRSLLSDETDGDTEDDSHISRVLRAYYVEKGRPFPQWLPPDPKSSSSSSYGNSYGSQTNRQQQAQLAQSRRGGGLSDLWDSPAPGMQPQQPQSLRRSEGSAMSQAMRGGSSQPPTQPPTPLSTKNSYTSTASTSSRLQPVGSRPQPDSRSGSFQGQSLRTSRTVEEPPPVRPSPGPTYSSSGSAQDRLKAKLWGGNRSNSPGGGPSTPQQGNPYDGRRN